VIVICVSADSTDILRFPGLLVCPHPICQIRARQWHRMLCLEVALKAADYSGFEQRRQESARDRETPHRDRDIH